MEFLWVEFAPCKQYLMDSYDKYHSSTPEMYRYFKQVSTFTVFTWL